MKQTFTKVLFLVFLLSVFSGCATTSSSKDELVKSTPYEFKEISSEKQVLVYDKTISLPADLYAYNMQFSPTTEDELIISLVDAKFSMENTDHFMVIDLKTGKVKKDIKLDKNRYYYSGSKLTLSEDGKKLYLRDVLENPEVCKTDIKKCHSFVLKSIQDKFVILDLDTGELSPYYSYKCDELIPKEYKNKEAEGLEAYCAVWKSGMINKIEFLKGNYAKYGYEDKINKKSGQGIAVYDKDTFKPKKIITADGKLDTEFKIKIISRDGQYVLFEKNEKVADNKYLDKYILYDLKNEKILHTFYSPFTVWGGQMPL